MYTEIIRPPKQPEHYTLNIVDGLPEVVSHNSLAEAEKHARDVAAEGYECSVLKVLSVRDAAEPACQNLDQHYGLRPGVDYPATLTGGAACRA